MPNELDRCLAGNDPAAAATVWGAYQNLCLNRPEGFYRLLELLSTSTSLKARYLPGLNRDDDKFHECCSFIVQRLHHQRHDRHNFFNASALIGYLLTRDEDSGQYHLPRSFRKWETGRPISLDDSIPSSHENGQQRTLLDSLGDPSLDPEERIGVTEEVEASWREQVPVRISCDEALRKKAEIDELLVTFLRTFLEEQRNPATRRRLARLFWEVMTEPLPVRERSLCVPDFGWPYWRLRYWIEGDPSWKRYTDSNVTERLRRLGFQSDAAVYTWKSRELRDEKQNKEKQKKRGCTTWTSFWLPHTNDVSLDLVKQIHAVLADQPAPSHLPQLRNVLGIDTAWSEALEHTIRAQPDGKLFVALYPPEHDLFVIPSVLELREKLEEAGQRVCIAWDDEEQLLPLLKKWERRPPRLAIVPEPGCFPDLLDALGYLEHQGWATLMFLPSEVLFLEDEAVRHRQWIKERTVIELAVLHQPSDLAAEEAADFDELRSHFENAEVLEAILLFSAWKRMPPVEVIAAGANVTPQEVLKAVGRAAGFLVTTQLEGERKVAWDWRGRAQRFLMRRYDGKEGLLAERYRRLFTRLRPSDPRHRRAVRNLFTYWHWIWPRQLRLARLCISDQYEERASFFEFAHRESSDDQESRRLWAEIFAWMGEFQQAHDVLSMTLRTRIRPAVEQLNASIFSKRFHVTGEIRFRGWADNIYQELTSAAPAQADLWEDWASLYLDAGDANRALSVLDQITGTGSDRAEALRATAQAKLGLASPPPPSQSGKTPRYRGYELDPFPYEGIDVYEQRWNAHVEHLLREEPRRSSPTPLHQAAARAIERGHFQLAQKLIEKGLAIDPDNLLLAMAQAKLQHERGCFAEARKLYRRISEELGGKENALLNGAMLDSALEAFHQNTNDKAECLDTLPRVLEGLGPVERELAPLFWDHLICLDAKAYWYGLRRVLGNKWQPGPAELADRLAPENLKNPARLNLAAKILAAAGKFSQARQKAQAALKLSESDQSRIVCHNTLAEILTLEATQCQAQERLVEAKDVLRCSLELDPKNGHTVLALGGVLRDLGQDGDEYLTRAAEYR